MSLVRPARPAGSRGRSPAPSGAAWRALAWAVAGAVSWSPGSGCGPTGSRPDGASCARDGDCASGFCSDPTWAGDAGPTCADPLADEDGDGLGARLERLAGTDPGREDTDGDGLSDAQEVGDSPTVPLDSDSDGKPDALESNVADADGDCLPDHLDAHPGQAASGQALGAFACSRGVCAGGGALGVCVSPSQKIRCEVSPGVPYEFGDETLCDGLDNDCDGQADEQLDGKAGKACADEGVCAGAAVSRCQSATWFCNYGQIDGYESIEATCDGLDNDCDGQTDEGTCDDGVDCTLDTCAGSCKHTPADVLCADGNPCTTDVCEAAQGCRYLPHIGQCDDGNPCTTGESCKKSACAGGSKTICDDGNNCTINPCDKQKGCQSIHVSFGASCQPGVPCYQAGVCENGGCVSTIAVDCDDANPCTKDACDELSGACTHAPLQSPCNDGNPCTTADACQGKVCQGVPLSTCCDVDADCKDKNPCTDDTCVEGACVNDNGPLEGQGCDDGNPCTLEEACSAGVCAAKLYNPCSDDNACTIDICDVTTGCAHKPLPNGAQCDDGDVCNGTALCKGGSCALGVALDCDDGNPCTKDACDPTKGCGHSPHTGDCVDGNACTVQDGCASGSCVGKPLLCDDGSVCTQDGCSIDSGCVHKPVPGSCDDGNPCTTTDACKAGKCLGVAVPCDDGKPCTVDGCDPATGCSHDAAAAENKACDDGNACTLGDVCTGAQCKSGVIIDCSDGNACTDDICDKVSGVCKSVDNTLPCDTGTGCMVDGVCDKGVCTGTSKTGCCSQHADCNDKNPCTLDICTSGDQRCEHGKLGAGSCADNSKCTIGGLCVGGKCVAKALDSCSDGKPCTIDYCLPDKGCQHLETFTGLCSNGDACDGLETCGPNGCEAGPPPVCDDANPCTLDFCQADKGCIYPWLPPKTPCDDGSACTQGDLCDGLGSCQGQATTGEGCCQTAAQCDDGYACTTDTCDPKTHACGFTPLGCKAGGACEAAWCQAGGCVTAQVCASPVVYAEGFEGKVPGWTASKPEGAGGAVGWGAVADPAAAKGSKSLHCGYGIGPYHARLPKMALTAGRYRLSFAARLDTDPGGCAKGALQATLGGQSLGKPLCKASAAMVSVDLPFEVTITGQSLQLELVFTAAATSIDPKRGAWVDALELRASAEGTTCVCGGGP